LAISIEFRPGGAIDGVGGMIDMDKGIEGTDRQTRWKGRNKQVGNSTCIALTLFFAVCLSLSLSLSVGDISFRDMDVEETYSKVRLAGLIVLSFLPRGTFVVSRLKLLMTSPSLAPLLQTHPYQLTLIHRIAFVFVSSSG